jgi:CRP-like cAMP-binding protein
MPLTKAKIDQLIDFLSKYILLGSQELIDLVSIIKYDSVNRNSLLMEKGKVSDHMAFILNGYARTYYVDAAGKEMTTHFHWEYSLLVSPRSFFGRQPVDYYTIAMEKMDGLYVHHQDMIRFMKKHPRFESIIKDIFRDAIPDISDHVKLLQMVSAEERYEYFIRTQPDVIKRVPQKHIATYLGMTSETLSRVRAKIK